MALLVLLAFLLATAATPAAVVAMDNGTHDGSKTATSSPVLLCNGEGCEPPAQALPIYGYPPPAPSLPSAPPAPPSAPGSQTLCPPVTVVCCGGGGAGGQFPQQPNNYGPPAGGYVPYYSNASASPPVLLVPVTAGYYVMVIACIFLLWTLV